MIRKLRPLVLITLWLLPVFALWRARDDMIEYENDGRKAGYENRIGWELDQMRFDINPVKLIPGLVHDFINASRSDKSSAHEYDRLLEAYNEVIASTVPNHEIMIVSLGNDKYPLIFRAGKDLGFMGTAVDLAKLIDWTMEKTCKADKKLIKCLAVKVSAYFREKLLLPIPPSQLYETEQTVFIARDIDNLRIYYSVIYPARKKILFFIADLKHLGDRVKAGYYLNKWPHEDLGLCFIDLSGETSFFGKYFDDKPELKANLSNDRRLLIPTLGSWSLDGFSIHTRPGNGRDRYKAVIVGKQLSIPAKHTLSLSLGAISIIYCFLIINFGVQKTVFNRGPDISVKTTVIMVFLSSCVLWFVSCVTGQHFLHSKLTGEKRRFHAELINVLESIDDNARREEIRYINTLKSFSDLTAIEDLVGRKLENENYEQFFEDFINKFISKFNTSTARHRLINLFAAIGRMFQYVISVNNDCKIENVNKSESDLITAIISKKREPLADQFNDQTNGREKMSASGIDTRELVTDELRESVTSIFGDNIFIHVTMFPERVNVIHIKNKNNCILQNTLEKDGKPEVNLIWFWTSDTYDQFFLSDFFADVHNLPGDITLMARQDSKTRRSFSVYPSPQVERDYPLLADAVRNANTSDITVMREDFTSIGSELIAALPSKSLRAVIGGQRSTAKLYSEMDKLRRFFVAGGFVILLAAVLIGLGCANFFVKPMDKLVKALHRIEENDYNVRIDDSNLTDEFSSLARSFNSMAKGLQEARELKKFVSRSVQKAVTVETQLDIRTKTEICEAVILFSGICDFESFQKNNKPEKVFWILEKHLKIVSAAVGEFGGEIDKVIGDKIMVVFKTDDFTGFCDSVQAAMNVARKIDEETVNCSERLNYATGINSGRVLSGVVGAEKVRLDYTVIGDPVNLAARLQSMAQMVGGRRIVVSGAVHSAMSRIIDFEKLPFKSVRGKTQQIEAFLVRSFTAVI